MRRSPIRHRRPRTGQIMIEFLFGVIIFMMLMAFVRTFVTFELDVFNHTNVARFKTLQYVRSGGFNESGHDYTIISDQDFQKISTSWLRPIPFVMPAGSDWRKTQLPERTLHWGAGTDIALSDTIQTIIEVTGILGAVAMLGI